MPWRTVDLRRRQPQTNDGPKLLPVTGRTLTVRLLEDRRNELLEQLRPMAPDLVYRLELTLEALREQGPEQSEYEGLGRGDVIRKYLLRMGRPTELGEIRDAVAFPASRFTGRSIWDGGKREVEQGRLINVSEASKGETWMLALPEWQRSHSS
jgi:hypothetical protein